MAQPSLQELLEAGALGALPKSIPPQPIGGNLMLRALRGPTEVELAMDTSKMRQSKYVQDQRGMPVGAQPLTGTANPMSAPFDLTMKHRPGEKIIPYVAPEQELLEGLGKDWEW